MERACLGEEERRGDPPPWGPPHHHTHLLLAWLAGMTMMMSEYSVMSCVI